MQGHNGCRLINSVISSSCSQYSWNHLEPSPLACATSSIDDEAAVLMIYGMSNSAAISATPSSRSSWKMVCAPTGETRSGES
jgi:hypothetical protein